MPELSQLYEQLAEAIHGWADSLGTESEYCDPRIEERGSNDWGDGLISSTKSAFKTTVSLLTAHGKTDMAEDIRNRFEELYRHADAYQQGLESLEDRRRVHVDGLVSRFRQEFGQDHEPHLWAQCKGINRIWTLWDNGNPMETVEQFAEAVDKCLWEEQHSKLRLHAETKRGALDLAEHVELLLGVETKRTKAQESAASAKIENPKCGKRGPARMPLEQAWLYLGIVQEWFGIHERNKKLAMRDRYQKVQLAEKHGITKKELDAMLGWYAKHRAEKRFPNDPRTLSKGELEKLFV